MLWTWAVMSLLSLVSCSHRCSKVWSFWRMRANSGSEGKWCLIRSNWAAGSSSTSSSDCFRLKKIFLNSCLIFCCLTRVKTLAKTALCDFPWLSFAFVFSTHKGTFPCASSCKCGWHMSLQRFLLLHELRLSRCTVSHSHEEKKKILKAKHLPLSTATSCVLLL